MVYLCPQRGCTGVHNLSQEEVGRTFTCNKCGATLRFDGDGLRLLSPPSSPGAPPGRPAAARPPAREDDEDIPMLPVDTGAAARARPNPAPRNPTTMPVTSPAETRFADVLFTGLYAIGTCVVILFLFLPLIDRDKEAEYRARADAKDIDLRRKERKADRDKESTDGKSDKDGTEELAKKRHDLNTYERPDLLDDAGQEQVRSQQSYWIYSWGMLVGNLLLALASAGLVAAASVTSRRVLGVVTLLAQVVLVFGVYLGSTGSARRYDSPPRPPQARGIDRGAP